MRILIALMLALASVGAFAAPKYLILNEDNDHFFKLDSSWMNRDGLVRYAREVMRGKVTHFSMCVNGQRTSYDSKTWEPVWKGIDEAARPDTATRPDGTHDRWAVNAKILFDARIDPYEVWIAIMPSDWLPDTIPRPTRPSSMRRSPETERF